jgi:hypothetical protein
MGTGNRCQIASCQLQQNVRARSDNSYCYWQNAQRQAPKHLPEPSVSRFGTLQRRVLATGRSAFQLDAQTCRTRFQRTSLQETHVATHYSQRVRELTVLSRPGCMPGSTCGLDLSPGAGMSCAVACRLATPERCVRDAEVAGSNPVAPTS